VSSGTVDLAVDGSTIITPEGRRRGSIFVSGGRFVTGGAETIAHERVDANGLFLLPGFVDTHVHLMEQADPSREDWAHGTAAAAASGVTTIVEHTHGAPVRSGQELNAKANWVDGRSNVDFALAAHAWPDRIREIEGIAAKGAAFLKVFTCTTHGVPGFSDEDALRAVFRETARVGLPCLVHAEDEAMTGGAEHDLRAAGRIDGGVIPEWRSRQAELKAVDQVLRLAEETGARVVIAHASHPAVLDGVAEARARGADVSAETCPQYLTLLEGEVERDGGLRKFTPPARARSMAELDAMWAAVVDGRVHHLSTDHAPSTLEQKGAGSIWDVHFGLPGLDTTSAILIDGALAGRLSLERLSEVYATAPARAYGLDGKGSLEPGRDADFVLIDPNGSWTITNEGIRSKAGWTPYEGRQVRGRIVATFVRGHEAYRDGAVTDVKRGRVVRTALGRST
jgi:dihydroorotase (multifunctional complex type)